MAVATGRFMSCSRSNRGFAFFCCVLRIRISGAHGCESQRGSFQRGMAQDLQLSAHFVRPESVADGVARTGDKGWLDADGYLYLSGRFKDSLWTLGVQTS